MKASKKPEKQKKITGESRPKNANKPCAKINFNHLVEFGSVIQGQSFQHEILFENVSDIKGSVKFQLPSDSILKITPMKFDLDPLGNERSSILVKFSMEAKDIGFFREQVKVAIVGALGDEMLEVTAHVVEQNITLDSSGRCGDDFVVGALFTLLVCCLCC